MLDKFGNKLEIGDHVLYITTGMDYSCNKGRIISFGNLKGKHPNVRIVLYENISDPEGQMRFTATPRPFSLVQAELFLPTEHRFNNFKIEDYLN